MDLEKNEEEKAQIVEKLTFFYENKVEVNGESDHGESLEIRFLAETKNESEMVLDKESTILESEIESSPEVVTANSDEIGSQKEDELPSNTVGSQMCATPESAASKPTPTTPESVASKSTQTKGYGLKKWRRIPRDLIKDGHSGADSSLILKRRLLLAEPAKARDEHKLRNDDDGVGEVRDEDLVASVEVRNTRVEVMPRAVTPPALDPELGILVSSTGFSIGADSDDSDEWSSKTSVAANVPRLRHEAIGFGRERNKIRNYGLRGLGHAVQQRGQRGRGAGGVDANKKFRGDQVRFKKETLLSSVESKLRSSNAAFVRWGSLVSNGRHGERLGNYVRNHSDDAQASWEGQSGYYKENGGGDDMSEEDLGGDPLEKDYTKKNENHQPQSNLDPFLESIVLFQATQEALENEIQRFGEIGKPVSPLDDSCGQSEEAEGSTSPSFEAHLTELNQKIESLEHKLEEASATVKAKESKVLELEAILSTTQPLKIEMQSTNLQLLHQKCEEMEFELESLLKKKMEAEIEYLIIMRTTQSLKVLTEDHMALLEVQKSLAEDQAQMMSKLRDAENDAIMLKRHVEELEVSSKELLVAEDVLKLQNRVYKLSICSIIQLMMVCIALGLFLLQLLPSSNEVVPT